MAEIPVEKKSGMPWWLWLVLAALIVALLVWIFADNDREAIETAGIAPPIAAPAIGTAIVPVVPVGTEPAATGPAATGQAAADPAAAAGGPITDLAAITGAGDVTSMIGREVRLTGVPVTSMTGDRTFMVGEGSERLFVLLPEGRPGLPSEDSVNVNEGQTVTLSGTLRNARDAVAGTAVQGMPSGTEAMLVADSVQIVSR